MCWCSAPKRSAGSPITPIAEVAFCSATAPGRWCCSAVERSEGGVIYSSLHADGNGWEMLCCQPGSRHPIDAAMLADRDQYMKIKGREVYKFAVQRFEELIEDAMRKCELTADDVKLIVPHQVNQRIIDSAMDKLGLGMDKAFVNIDRTAILRRRRSRSPWMKQCARPDFAPAM